VSATTDDDVSVDELREAVEHLHGVSPRVWSMGELLDAAMAAGGTA
jgi:hypothetical protein